VALLGGVELGGTHVRCALAATPAQPGTRLTLDTGTPEATLAAVRAFFEGRDLAALGIASFGPVQIDPGQPAFGQILDTPKAAWQGTDLLAPFRDAEVPLQLDTDVNAAALAEWRAWPSPTGRVLVYLTVGTGLGAGILVDGTPLPGRQHAEVGHSRIPRHPDDEFGGCCPFHGDCLEGLASGTAMARRWGQAAETLPQEHPAWELEAWYLAVACLNLTRTVAPGRIVLGGGVMAHDGLLDRIRAHFLALQGGYHGEEGAILATPQLGGDAGLIGALTLAADGLRR